MSNLRRVFDRFDQDGSGFIEINELERLLRELGLDTRDDDAVLAAMAKLRTADPNRVSWQELEAWWARVGEQAASSKPLKAPTREERPSIRSRRTLPAPSEVEIRAVFDRFDRDGNGEIDSRELAKLLEAAGIDVDDEQLAAAMRNLDRDSSGRLSWDEFRDWWDENYG